jgi:hypothetical protein
MSKRKGRGLLTTLALVAITAGACSRVPDPMYTGPGWYLEKPVALFVAGPRIYGGPFSYEQCEAERTKLPQSTAERMLCFRHLVAPGATGPYLIDRDRPQAPPASAPPSPDSVTSTQQQPASTGPKS